MKKYRKRICACMALILTVAVIVGVVWNDSRDSYAHETFTGVSQMVSDKVQNNKEFVILEIVDDLDEASIGYLVDGQEPYANRLNSMTAQEQSELIAELQEKGLMAADDLAEQSAYPISFASERVLSTDPEDQALLDSGYLQQVDEETGKFSYKEVKGYFIAQESDDTGYEGYYRLTKADIADDTLTYADIVERLQASYTGELFTTDGTYTAYQFVADETADVPDLIENYEITVHRFGPLTDADGNITGYGYNDTVSDENMLLEVLTTDDEGRVELSDLDTPDYLAEDGTKYQFSHYALGTVDGEAVDDDYVYTDETDVWAVYVEIPTDEFVVNVYFVEAVYDTDGTTIIEYREIEGDTERLVTTDQKITLPTATVYDGYTFTGKYLLSDMLTEVTADYIYTANTDIYVAYTQNTPEVFEVTVHYGSPVKDADGNVNDYEYVEANTIVVETAEDGTIELPDENTVEGYTFVGYSATAKDATVLLDGTEVYTADSDIYAVYETASVSETPTTTEEPDASETPTPTEEPDASETPTPTEEPDASETPTPTEEPDASETPTPTEEPDASVPPTPTEDPDASVTPTPAEDPDTARLEIDVNGGALLASNGTYIPVTVLAGTPVTKPANMAKLAGYGYQFMYERVSLANNNRFKSHVLGLEEGTEEFNRLNIRVITYTADGKESAWTNTNNLSLAEAIETADLIYISGNGRNAAGVALSAADDMSIGNVQTLFKRAANDRMPVIMDFSVYTSDATTDNLWKLACLLLQPDLSAAYVGLNSTNFAANDWDALKSSVSINNGGNFVRDNVFCVNYQSSSFNNSIYASDGSGVNVANLYPLVNADFEKAYTDEVSDYGFGKVYQAIQQENYERGQSNSGQSSMNEYVSPAVAVAFILNFEGYDPIIYKDTIRVLELQPCRDYTYYYDGDVTTDAGKAEQRARKLRFAEEWAPAFSEKLDSITIVGMTTSEFCGKISDVYEEYDVIYFGANTGLMNMRTVGGGDVWNESSVDYQGYIRLSNVYLARNYIDENTLWEYENGVWYRTQSQGTQEVTEWSEWSESAAGLGYDWYDTDDHRYWCPNANWRWDTDNAAWMERVDARDNNSWSDDSQWEITGNHYPYDIEIEAAWGSDGVLRKWKYDASDGKWYSSVGHSYQKKIWGARTEMPDGLPYDWYNGTDQWNTADSTWKWDQGTHRWLVKEKEATHTVTAYNDVNMYGMVYTHTGDLYNTWSAYYGLIPDEGNVGFRMSGNDILEDQAAELLEFLESGSPIILDADFMTYDSDGAITGINSSDVKETIREKHSWEDVYDEYVCHGILDTSSYVYRFASAAYAEGYPNLLIDGTSDETDMAAALNKQKMTLNMLSVPTEYSYTETADELGSIVDCIYLSKESDGKYYLNYEFSISNLSAVTPLTTRYDVRLYLDSNGDGIYNEATEELKDIVVTNAQTGEVVTRVLSPVSQGDASELHYELSANTPYIVRRELPEDYVGSIGWKLKATQVGNKHIHDSAVGLTAVKNEAVAGEQIDPITGKRIIHVLQIISDGGYTLDLENQTEGIYAGSDWDILLDSIPDFVVDFDTILESDFAYSFENTGAYYDPRNDSGSGGYLTGQTEWNNELGAYARRKDYLNFYDYDMVIVGFADKYSNLPSERATEALLAYGESGKSLMYTHDTTFTSENVMQEPLVSDFSNTGTTSTLSMSIRAQCGMDRYGVSVNWYSEGGNDNPIRSGSQADTEAIVNYNEMNERLGSDIAYLPGSNQAVMAAQTQGFTYSGMAHNVIGYSNLNYSGIAGGLTQASWMFGPGAVNHNRVTQVNSGIITRYPYTIDEEIIVSNTHAQYFQVDLDTDGDGDGRGDVVVWYCISSLDDSIPWNTNGEFVPNDVYDYSPNDVRNNYYIYNKGNITYTGVGHDGNYTIEEKKLFINTFVAAYNAGVRNPSVRIVDGVAVNAPDLELVNIPYDEANITNMYRVYFQVQDTNITTGTKDLSVRYCIGNAGSTDTISYADDEVHVSWFTDGELVTYDAISGDEVLYNQLVSGSIYYVDVPLNALAGAPESFDFYVEIDLVLDGDIGIAAYAIDKLTICELKLFDLD